MKTTQECWQALIDGEKLQYWSGETTCLVDGKVIGGWCFDSPQDWSIYKAPEWYDNIPEGGVLCRWGSDGPALIMHGVDKDGWFIDKNGETYSDATPLTKQEIQVLLDNAPEGEKE